MPVQITDATYDSSVIGDSNNAQKYVSGTEAVGDGDQAQESGIAILTDSGGATGVNFEYCITVSPSLSGNETWQTAKTGEELAFIQVTNGNYIHIRPAENGEVFISEPVLTVRGYDYAGNSGEASVTSGAPLYERVAPQTDAALSSSTTTTSSASGSASVTDMGGIAEVKYLIETTASDSSTAAETVETPTVEEAEAATDWQTVEEVGDGSLTRVDIAIQDLLLTANKNNFVYVHVYARDRSGNAVVNTQAIRTLTLCCPHLR